MDVVNVVDSTTSTTTYCPNDFPNPDTYSTLTEDMALQAMATAAIVSTYNAHMPSSSTINTPFIPQSTYNAQPAAFIEEIPNDSTPSHLQSSVAAVLPSSSTPFVLGTRESDTELNNSTISLISVSHYIWHANVHGISEFPTPVNCLLDNGAHLVLIRPGTVADLGLRIQKLHKPQRATVAINSQRHTFLLADYVFLTLSSLNNAWTSWPVRALIAPDLCINILLGLPFIKHNKIVIDHDADTAIDKLTGFDLLNENKSSPLLIPTTPRLSPKQKRDNILHIRRQVLEELQPFE
jgi:Aspartyl protease